MKLSREDLICSALVLFGNGVADIRGSINGTTFSRTKAGAIARNRTIPINPNTVSQSFNRVRFGSQASGWTGLSDAVQLEWVNLAAGASRLNRLGQAYVPSGRQLYMESSNNLAILGIPALLAAPVTADIPAGPSYSGLDLQTDAGPPRTWLSLILQGGTLDPATSVIVKATPPNPGPKTNFANLYRVIFADDNSPDLDVQAGYENVFGTVPGVTGTPISILVSYVAAATGFRSPELRLDGVVPTDA